MDKVSKGEFDSPWDRGHSIDVLREVAAGIVPSVQGFKAIAVDAGGVPAEWVLADGVKKDAPTALYFHGGAYLCGTLQQYRNATVGLSRAASVRVLSVDYRLAPEHPHPAAFEDALASYRWLLEQPGVRPDNLLLAGDSAGASIAVNLSMDAMALGLDLPACIIANSPFADLTLSSPSLKDPSLNLHEPNKTTIEWLVRTYLQSGQATADKQVNASDPQLSPVYRDLKGLPPLLVQTGGLDNLQDDGVRLASQAGRGGVITKHTHYPHSGHIWVVLQTPEQDPYVAAAFDEMKAFSAEHLLG